MSELGQLQTRDPLKYWLDKVKEGDPSVFQKIPLIAENNPSHARKIIRQVYDRIQDINKRMNPSEVDLKLQYFYVLDAILKRTSGKFATSFEEIVIPDFASELDMALSNKNLLCGLLELFTSWEGKLNMEQLNDTLKRVLSKHPSLV